MKLPPHEPLLLIQNNKLTITRSYCPSRILQMNKWKVYDAMLLKQYKYQGKLFAYLYKIATKRSIWSKMKLLPSETTAFGSCNTIFWCRGSKCTMRFIGFSTWRMRCLWAPVYLDTGLRSGCDRLYLSHFWIVLGHHGYYRWISFSLTTVVTIVFISDSHKTCSNLDMVFLIRLLYAN